MNPSNRKKALSRLTALLLALLLFLLPLSGCALERAAADVFATVLEEYVKARRRQEPDAFSEDAQTQAQQDEDEPPYHAQIDFSQMRYTPPDLDAFLYEIDQMDDVARDGDFSQVLAQCDKVDEMYISACTQYSLLCILQSQDVNDDYYYEESIRLYEELSDAEREMNHQLTRILQGKYRPQLEQEWGEDYVQDVLMDSELYGDSVAELLNRDNELCLQYSRICEETQVQAYGRSWTYAQLWADDTLDYDSYFEVYDLYCRTLCDNLGELFLELVDVRNQIAETLGYESYAQYRYCIYERDYTPQDTAAFAALVKEYITPIYAKWQQQSKDAVVLYSRTFDDEEVMQRVGEKMHGISPLLGDAYDYMREYHLYDVGSRAGKEDGGYTTYLEEYGAPFLFLSYGGSYSAASAIVHELGHYAGYYSNPGEGVLDLAEIDSQGLEMLMMAHYPELYGSVASAAAGERLSDTMDSIVSGCLQDEFQRIIYENDDMTMEQIAQLYDRLNEEYGVKDSYPVSPYSWVLVNHTFETPFYYISYAASAVPALGIWQSAREDREAGQQLYLSLLMRDHEDDFMEVLSSLGFADPFARETIASLADALDAEMVRTQSRTWQFSAS